jgi:beta-glucosidase/6-phospho-beta-glucosidase/beta-galactosidase
VNDVPPNFGWGVSTAAHQVEVAALIDGRGRCIWDNFTEYPNTVANNDTGAVADDFYHKYREDIANMQSLGIKHFRMSISWSRVLPDGTINNFNQKGVDFYND